MPTVQHALPSSVRLRLESESAILPAMAPSAAWLPGLALIVVGCGHPASREECEALFKRNAELELAEQNITKPEDVELKIAELREARGAIIDRCVGIRITTEAVQCIEHADTKEKVEACLD